MENNTMSNPTVSIIMPVHNGEKYIKESIESILSQTHRNFEFIIINDGSTDNTLLVLEEYSKRDSRIIIKNNVKNKGISNSLNSGLKLARAPLIARMDSDDIAYPNRLETQVRFMQENPEVSVCGSSIKIYEAPEICWVPPLQHDAILVRMLFESCLYHPTVMFRKETIVDQGGYNVNFSGAEDYDLWCRLSRNISVRFANISEPLLCYRTHTNTTNRSPYKERQSKLADIVRNNQISYLGLPSNPKSLACHSALSNPKMLVK